MADPHLNNDRLTKFTAQAILASIRVYLDEYALEIFSLWFSGKAPPEVIFDNPKWAAYMKADPGLEAQIDRHLVRYAQKFRDDFIQRSPDPNRPLAAPNQHYQTCFHAEVGSTYGGYKTGYAQLHGSNQSVGDFQMQGAISMAPAPGSPSELEFRFTNNQMSFNDRVDPNFKYKADAVFANLAKNLAASTGGLPPKDFTLRIRWAEPGPWIYTIPAAPSKPGQPEWLRTFPNRP